MSDFIATKLGRGLTSGQTADALLDRSGATVVMDFFQKAIMDGKGFQLRAGTISVPAVGDVVITDTAAEMAVDALSGMVVIPTYLGVGVNLAAATLYESAVKSVGAISTSGTAFVPLPLLMGGAAASGIARVQTAGNVVVTAELATTTRIHYSWAQPIAAGAYTTSYEWQPAAPPVLNGAASLYVQIAAATTGPSYFANLDYVEFTASQLGL